MEPTYSKIDENTIQATIPQPDMIVTYDVPSLTQKLGAIQQQLADTETWYTTQKAALTQEASDTQALIDEATQLGIAADISL